MLLFAIFYCLMAFLIGGIFAGARHYMTDIHFESLRVVKLWYAPFLWPLFAMTILQNKEVFRGGRFAVVVYWLVFGLAAECSFIGTVPTVVEAVTVLVFFSAILWFIGFVYCAITDQRYARR